jgi:hypothetical protein
MCASRFVPTLVHRCRIGHVLLKLFRCFRQSVQGISHIIRLGSLLGASSGLISLVIQWQAIVDNRRYARFDAVLVSQYAIDQLGLLVSKSFQSSVHGHVIPQV